MDPLKNITLLGIVLLALAGCVTQNDISREFSEGRTQADSWQDPDRSYDATFSLKTRNQSEVELKELDLAKKSLLYQPDRFKDDVLPLIETVTKLPLSETTDEQQSLAYLGGVANQMDVRVTRTVRDAVRPTCRPYRVSRVDVSASPRERAEDLLAESCYFTLGGNGERVRDLEIRGMALYEMASLEELLPSYLSQTSQHISFTTQVLIGRLCEQLGILCD